MVSVEKHNSVESNITFCDVLLLNIKYVLRRWKGG